MGNGYSLKDHNMKKVFLLALLSSLFLASVGQRISELPNTGTPLDADLMLIVQGGVTKNMTYLDFVSSLPKGDTALWYYMGGNIWNKNTGYVGIGIEPTKPLHVAGSALFADSVFLDKVELTQTLRWLLSYDEKDHSIRKIDPRGFYDTIVADGTVFRQGTGLITDDGLLNNGGAGSDRTMFWNYFGAIPMGEPLMSLVWDDTTLMNADVNGDGRLDLMDYQMFEAATDVQYGGWNYTAIPDSAYSVWVDSLNRVLNIQSGWIFHRSDDFWFYSLPKTYISNTKDWNLYLNTDFSDGRILEVDGRAYIDTLQAGHYEGIGYHWDTASELLQNTYGNAVRINGDLELTDTLFGFSGETWSGSMIAATLFSIDASYGDITGDFSGGETLYLTDSPTQSDFTGTVQTVMWQSPNTWIMFTASAPSTDYITLARTLPARGTVIIGKNLDVVDTVKASFAEFVAAMVDTVNANIMDVVYALADTITSDIITTDTINAIRSASDSVLADNYFYSPTLIDDGSGIGIGTRSPTSKLDVDGNASFSGYKTIIVADFDMSSGSNAGYYIYYVNPTDANLDIWLPAYSGSTDRFYYITNLDASYSITIRVQEGDKLNTATDGSYSLSSQNCIMIHNTGISTLGWLINMSTNP